MALDRLGWETLQRSAARLKCSSARPVCGNHLIHEIYQKANNSSTSFQNSRSTVIALIYINATDSQIAYETPLLAEVPT